MPASLVLSRYQLDAFQVCQRRFQLRYLHRLPWPPAPPDEAWREALVRGEAFHRLLERRFLELPVEGPATGDAELERWWRAFQRNGPELPDGERLPEISLTAPVGNHLLTGRFDLLIVGERTAYIYDWKTEMHPRPADALRDDWQTRLYLALLVEGAPALGRAYEPEDVAITYWFAHAPQQSITIPYDGAWHEENWRQLQSIVDKLDAQLATTGDWPLTDDLSACARCLYQVYCGRQDAVPAEVGQPLWAGPDLEPAIDPAFPLENLDWK